MSSTIHLETHSNERRNRPRGPTSYHCHYKSVVSWVGTTI